MISSAPLLSVYQLAWQATPRRVRRTPNRPAPPAPPSETPPTDHLLRPSINFDKPTFPDSSRIVGSRY